MTHRIRQHVIHVDLNGTEADGLALQSRLPALCYATLLPALERVLDRYAPADEYLSIDRLEINAGTLTLGRFDTDLAKAVAESLDRALREQDARVNPLAVPDREQRRTEQESVETALFYFLKTGRLPWSFRLPPGRTLEQTVLDYWQEAPDSVVGFRVANDAMRRALASATARQRMMAQFSPVFWQIVLARLWPEGRDRIEAVMSTLRGSDEGQSDVQFLAVMYEFERQLWETVLAHLATGGTPTETELVGETGQRLPAPRQHPALVSRLARHWPGVTDDVSASPLSIKHLDVPLPESGKSPGPMLETDKDDSDSAAGIYIDNAGLILLHPFLPRFFDVLGIAGDDKLLQPKRALGLLHFLATGQRTAPEHELTLPKVLCNIPLATPVKSDVALTEAETNEADALLRAVIRHWDALRSTSPDGLRGTFLLRPGKLSLRPDGDWLLQVEPSTYDILLDQLPWGISIIKLPWMARILWVEWH